MTASPQTAAASAGDRSARDILKSLARAMMKIHLPETDAHGNPNLSRFLVERGRLPFVGDEIKPWKYRGWLVPYIQLAEMHPRIAPRYAYVHRTFEANRILDEPIPQVDFVGEFEQAVKPGMKMLGKCLAEVEYTSGSWNGIREFCEWLAFAVGVSQEPSKLSEKLQEFLYRNFNLELLLLNPSDYFGQILCETNYGKKNGFFPTPICIVEMMARMATVTEGDLKTKTFIDPVGCGTGRMLLIGSNYSLRLYGMDIDHLCVLMTKINLALYAPWFYIPEAFYAAEITETAVDTDQPVKNEPAPLIEQNLPCEDESRAALFEKMRLEKTKRQTYSTKIENLPLFDFTE